ncbi:MAG: sensor hybrid histidine kinase [Betaproteobacteria bacterium]|nr:sensor hybrid histidine kinase [Betaproteobacteria bacterium]
MPATQLDSAVLSMAGAAPAPVQESLRSAALLKAGTLQAAIFNTAAFSIICTDEMGVIQLFNAGAERMFGYQADELINKSTPAILSDSLEVLARAVVMSREADAPVSPGFETLVFKAARGSDDSYELTHIRKDGGRVPAIVSVSALHDLAGKIIGYLFVSADNSTRKEVEEQLRWSEESFRLIVDSVTDCAFVVLDPQGMVTGWNAGAQRLHGYPENEIVGRHYSRLYANADVEGGVPQRDLDAAAAQGRCDGEGWRVRKDGTQFRAYVAVTAIRDPLGKLRGFGALSRDLTERREAEAAAANAKTLAEKNQIANAEFLSGMSHEVRTSLNAILGFAQLMGTDSPPPTSAQKEGIAKIEQAGWYLLELATEIHDLATIEAGRLAWSLEPTSLADLMLDCQAGIEPQAQKSGIRMSFTGFDAPCFVKADRTRVKQVLDNLLSNAVKYNQPGGSVVVECSASNAQRIRVSVTDTGAGLQPAQLEQLFRPFSRVGQETSAAPDARIGLVVTKRLVELMGGSIGVRSHVGKGSVFWIELVAAQAPQLAPADAQLVALAQPAIAADAPPRTLLYVEDNPANLQLVEQIIGRRPDMRLLSARTGPLGIALARSARPDVILMDINLPGMSGIKAMQTLHADTATAHIPVVALSANAIPRDIERGIEAGFFRYLTKPIKVAEFMETLDVALEFAAQKASPAPDRR